MNQSLKNIISCFLLFPLTSFAGINPSDLIKVTPKTNPSCVEYFNYKDEMYCSTKQLANDTIDPNLKNNEKQKIIFDDRPWQAAWGEKSPVITTIEYIPYGDNINNWNELITSEFIPNVPENITPKSFADLSMAGIKKAGFSPIIKFIKDTPDQVILEFRIEKPSNQKQDELQIITKGKDGLYALHYVIKKSDMGQANRSKWINLLQHSSLKQ